jgi:dipeptidyl aminopeptidase/acylaminoacyl peptidase
MPQPLPKNRIWLSHTIAEPTFDEAGYLLYVRSGDGRSSLIRQDPITGLAQQVTAEPPPRASVGYGGGVYAVRGDLLVYAAEGGLVALDLRTGEQRGITPKYEGVAAPALSPCGRFVAFVVELGGHADVLLADTAGEQLPVKLTASPAFAANPTFSPDGSRLAWMEWDADHMPWEQCALKVARLARPAHAAAAPADLLPPTVATLSRERVSYANPQFSPDGSRLGYTSDESGWRSVYLADADGSGGERLDTGPGEIGGPDWVQGQFAVQWGEGGRNLYAIRRCRARQALVRVSLPERRCDTLDSTYTTFTHLAVRPGSPDDELAYTATSPKSPLTLVTRLGDRETVRASGGVGLNDPAGLSTPEIVEWPTADGTLVYGVLTPALNAQGPRPTLVMVHGGPTSERSLGWDPEAQYFAGRGWHCLQVNHRGGSGSGRGYQDMLDGAWGVVDVEDARTGAEYLLARGLADPDRIAITGGSAGGYTTLMALVKDPGFWTAGVSLYGIGNLYDLQMGSHRFEQPYNRSLIGPLPECAERWIERSPLTHVANVRAPVQLFHGKQDDAVPYEQSVEFAEAVRRQGGVAELVLYDDEGHGFRKTANRRDQIEKMEAFLEKYVINLQGKR